MHRIIKKNYHKQKGYIALLTVIIIGAVATVVATSVVLLGLGQSRSALSESQSVQARAAADACTEKALELIRLTSYYTGTGSLTVTGGSCSYTVTNTGGTTRQITASGTVGNNVRKNTVSITALSPTIVYSSWQETP